MKTKITSLLFILISSVVFGQTAEPVSSSKVSIGISFSPDYCYRTLNPQNDFSEVIAEIRDETEIAKIGYTVGLSLLYKSWNRVSIETGLYFSNKGYQTEFVAVYDLEPTVPIFVNRAKSNYQLYYLDIPLKLNYFVLTGRAKLFTSAGFSANIFLDQREKVSFEDPESTEIIKSDAEFSALSVAVILGVGIDYAINNKLNLRIEPVFRHAIIPLLDAPIKEYQYSAGANFGVYYTL
ncbi:MAG: outer membrane beta-barrel protein [Bacteroidales bacterium]|jgi:hypothetical protein|nr:outer membrane beta-barrel protein [Bacteroidales bacterium]